MSFRRLKLVKTYGGDYEIPRKSSGFNLLDAALGRNRSTDRYKINWTDINSSKIYSLQLDEDNITILNEEGEMMYQGKRDKQIVPDSGDQDRGSIKTVE